MKKYIYLIVSVSLLILLISCENVEDGYEVEYGQSKANFSVNLLSSDRGSKGDIATFSINAQSSSDIKSIIVSYKNADQVGSETGYDVDSTIGDPLLNHALGTIKPGSKTVDISYQYEFPSDTAENTITFTLIDGEGKAEVSFYLTGIPKIVAYNDIELVLQANYLLDGFSTADGAVYENLEDFKTLTAANIAIQKSIDIAFTVDDNFVAKIISPYDGNFGVSFSNKNKTVYKLLDTLSSADFDNLTNISLSEITEAKEVKKGTTAISSVKVGDIIGFRTDFASANAYKYGILRINAIHPTNVERYEGISYLIEIDVLTQQ